MRLEKLKGYEGVGIVMGFLHVLKTAKYTDDVKVLNCQETQMVQTKLIEMMRDVIKVLDKEKIRWYLSGGSVLGAVRHNGFIPWDDDLDIFMDRNSFANFKSIFDRYFSGKYELKIPGDKDYLLSFPRIQKLGTRLQSVQSVKNKTQGLYIDIFILENTYDNSILRFIHGLRCTCLLFIESSLRLSLCSKNILKYTNNNKLVKREINKRKCISWLFKFWPLEKWLKKSDAVFSSVKQRGKYVVCPCGAKHFFGELFLSSWFNNPKKMRFENEIWNVPSKPNSYLCKRYGKDYMVIPAIKDREKHAYVIFEI